MSLFLCLSCIALGDTAKKCQKWGLQKKDIKGGVDQIEGRGFVQKGGSNFLHTMHSVVL